ncbi:MAG: hydratase [Lachnospiraceae bacterium]|nr:hydratase [Lachnospiraceae bacterium]
MNKFVGGAYLVRGNEIVAKDARTQNKLEQILGRRVSEQTARRSTISYGILTSHNLGKDDENLSLRFDKLVSHDITYVGIIQTAKASGLTKFPVPYVLTNCHNSLCAVGGTINEDDHLFGLSAAKKYGGVYVPPHMAVIHQYAREVLAKCGDMILGSDSHTRYGALGTMAIGEGGPEIVKQLLKKTYDLAYPEVVAIYLKNSPLPGVGPQDVALSIIKDVFNEGLVKNRIIEFVGPGVSELSVDFRIGIDVMTTETTCLSSIWVTDEKVKEFYENHGREDDYKALNPGEVAYYDSLLEVDLSEVRPMIAMPFHPSNAYTIEFLKENLKDVLHETEERARVSFGEDIQYNLLEKVRENEFYVDQGIIAGCAGGGYENIASAAEILKGGNIGNDAFSLSVYPASMPIYMDILKKGYAEYLLGAGAVLKTAFCGPCFGAGDTPFNNGFSIRHSTRNFPNREGSKVQNGQIASVALMDARSIAATALNGGKLTAATDIDKDFSIPKYYFDSSIYEKRVFDSKGISNEKEELVVGPNIKDWPKMNALPNNLLLKVTSEIHDPVTTTDELIPSGETSSYRSNPIELAKFTLSRKDPLYVGEATKVKKAYDLWQKGEEAKEILPELDEILKKIENKFDLVTESLGIGSTIFAVKPGDGSAREQAASCQKVLGGWANIAREYATKRYRSNLINWGMIPFRIGGEIPFSKGDYIWIPDIRKEIESGDTEFNCFVVNKDFKSFKLEIDKLTDTEKRIILDGCLINYYRMEN